MPIMWIKIMQNKRNIFASKQKYGSVASEVNLRKIVLRRRWSMQARDPASLRNLGQTSPVQNRGKWPRKTGKSSPIPLFLKYSGISPAYVNPISLLLSKGGAHLAHMLCAAGKTTPWKKYRLMSMKIHTKWKGFHFYLTKKIMNIEEKNYLKLALCTVAKLPRPNL